MRIALRTCIEGDRQVPLTSLFTLTYTLSEYTALVWLKNHDQVTTEGRPQNVTALGGQESRGQEKGWLCHVGPISPCLQRVHGCLLPFISMVCTIWDTFAREKAKKIPYSYSLVKGEMTFSSRSHHRSVNRRRGKGL